MANELTDAGELLALDLLNGGTQTITTPLKLALMTANGSDSSAGTEVTGGSYARQSITFNSAASGSVTNSNAISFTMPAATVTGWEIYDSSGTPKRLWAGAFGSSVTYTSGNLATVAAAAITLSLN
jgi:hypothetical protein